MQQMTSQSLEMSLSKRKSHLNFDSLILISLITKYQIWSEISILIESFYHSFSR